jgi:GNAT superfamily N-acetyltransferase
VAITPPAAVRASSDDGRRGRRHPYRRHRDRARRGGPPAALLRAPPQPCFHRFLAPVQTLSSRQVRHLTHVDHVAHEALIAFDARTGAGLGVARYVRDERDERLARFAIVVTDGMQRRGVGSALLTRLRERAHANGIGVLHGATAAGNRAARRLRASSTLHPRSGTLELPRRAAPPRRICGLLRMADWLRKRMIEPMPHCPPVHVRPDRLGRWTVLREGDEQPLSLHGSETEAERAATALARAVGARELVVRDRYERVIRRVT